MLLLLACSSTLVDHVPDEGRTSARQIDLARAIIEDGGIPNRSHFTTEGLLAEHDLSSTEPEDCAEACLRAWGARAEPIEGGGPQLLFQIGASDAPPMPRRFMVVVDTSSSVGATHLNQTVIALGDLSRHLNQEDMLGLVSFDDRAWVRMRPKIMNARGRADFRRALERLQVGGDTNTVSGLRSGYEQLFKIFEEGADNRLLLLTDDRPEDLSEVLRMVRTYGELGAALHVYALAVDLGADLANEIEATRGGRYYFVREEDLDLIFEDPPSVPACTGALATIELDEGYEWVGTLGFPAIDEPDGMDFRLPNLSPDMTPFALRVKGPTPNSGSWVGMLYLDCQDEPVQLEWLGGSELPFETLRADDEGVFKMAALWDEVGALEVASDWCEDGLTTGSAQPRVRQAADRLADEAELLRDDDLEREAELLNQLLENLDSGVDACF